MASERVTAPERIWISGHPGTVHLEPVPHFRTSAPYVRADLYDAALARATAAEAARDQLANSLAQAVSTVLRLEAEAAALRKMAAEIGRDARAEAQAEIERLRGVEAAAMAYVEAKEEAVEGDLDSLPALVAVERRALASLRAALAPPPREGGET